MQRIGLISDTHGLLRPEVVAFLAGSDRIVHAGDIGDPRIIERLAAIAPVTAVRGNNDEGPWAAHWPESGSLRVEDTLIHVIHDLASIGIDPRAAGVRIIVSGHSHVPVIRESAGVLYVNPGSAGRRRFRLPISVGELLIDGGSVAPRLQEIVPSS